MNKTLVVGPSWVGDMVMAQSLFKHLKTARETEITVLAPKWSQPVLARMPEVSDSLTMPVGHGKLALATRYRLGRKIRGTYAQAIVLPGSLKSALLPFFAGIPMRTGFVGEQRYGLLNDIRKLDRQQLPLHVQRVVTLGRPPDAEVLPLAEIQRPALQMDAENRNRLCLQFAVDQNKPVIALCPGAEFGPAKQWPIAHYAKVAQWAVRSGFQVIVLGSEKDSVDGDAIVATESQAINLAGKTGLGDAIDLMSLAHHVVTNDSGLMHIAAALQCHVIAIYGSSSNDYTPPLSPTSSSLSIDIDCRPCFKRTCPLGHTNCLNQLAVEQVIHEIEDFASS